MDEDTDIANNINGEEKSDTIASRDSIVDSRKLVKVGADSTDCNPRYLSFGETFANLKRTSSYKAPYSNDSSTKAENLTTSTLDASVTVQVNRCQTGNPLLKHMQNVVCEYRDGLIPDYVLFNANENTNTCILFLSIRFHLLHGSYLEERIGKIQRDDVTSYRNKIVICYVDIEDYVVALLEINRVTLLSQFTLVLSWSWQEAARYIETFKTYEQKPASLIQERVETDFLSQANNLLSGIRSVNKTDIVTLLSTFGTMKNLMNATPEEMAVCPGLGAKKLKNLLKAFQEPFIKS
uniref:DNA excision repair protein ERCC1 putative n=1 Tax=Albugo laibachii Nc14 TaxID=890382 RepID=F0X2M2_9STRA|nr:DNA excision repair protein ERCC1 putative [Albugo laibachii Nc14]|eukprot:CCA28137.1 DNA excision repair protein ERCC1 putative [Albugo laibachii Nc14]